MTSVVFFMISYLKLFRPEQWIKNLLIFAPLFFAGKLFPLGDSFWNVLSATIFFCFLASAIYIGNDIVDRERDSLHPKKRFRMIASGKVSVPVALGICGALLVISLGGFYCIAPKLFIVGLLYAVLNILYSFSFKHIAFLDIVTVSLFYLLRILAGGVAAEIVVSDWLILCALFLSLFLIIAKRKAEYVHDHQRAVLQNYSPDLLSAFLIIAASSTLMSYALYAVLGAKHKYMVYSVVFVCVGIMRYFGIAFEGSRAETPEKVLYFDPYIISSVCLWVAYVGILFYTNIP